VLQVLLGLTPLTGSDVNDSMEKNRNVSVCCVPEAASPPTAACTEGRSLPTVNGDVTFWRHK